MQLHRQTDHTQNTNNETHALEPCCLMQLAIPVVPRRRPGDAAALPQAGSDSVDALAREAAGQTPAQPAGPRAAAVAVAVAAVEVAVVAPDVQGGAERAPLAPRVEAAVLQPVPLDFVEQEVHLALHAEHLARARLLDLLVADAPPAVLLLLLGRLGRVRRRRREPV